MTQPTRPYDFIVIGGGFYGCCLGLFLRSISKKILLVEAADAMLTRASRVDQARIHTGFHYPRSIVTAARSATLSDPFAHDFREAVVGDFQMLYAIARRRSKVSAGRFLAMFTAMRAPIRPAGDMWSALFDSDTVEGVFECREHAFDYSVLRRQLAARLDRYGVEVRMPVVVEAAEEASGRGGADPF